MKTCPSSLIIREMQIKPHWDITSHHLGWLIIFKKDNKCSKIVTLTHSWWEYKNSAAVMKNSMEISHKIKNEATIGSSNLNSGYIFKRNEIRTSKRYLHSHIYCSTLHNSQHMKTAHVPINRLMDKENVYAYNGILFSF